MPVGALTPPGLHPPPVDTPASPESRRPWAGCSQESQSPPRSCLSSSLEQDAAVWPGEEHEGQGQLRFSLYPQFRLNAVWVQKSITLFQSAVTPGCCPHPQAGFGNSHSACSHQETTKPWGRCQVCAGRGSTWLSWAQQGKGTQGHGLQPSPTQARPQFRGFSSRICLLSPRPLSFRYKA